MRLVLVWVRTLLVALGPGLIRVLGLRHARLGNARLGGPGHSQFLDLCHTQFTCARAQARGLPLPRIKWPSTCARNFPLITPSQPFAPFSCEVAQLKDALADCRQQSKILLALQISPARRYARRYAANRSLSLEEFARRVQQCSCICGK